MRLISNREVEPRCSERLSETAREHAVQALSEIILEVEELRAALDNDKASPILHLQLANLLFPLVRG